MTKIQSWEGHIVDMDDFGISGVLTQELDPGPAEVQDVDFELDEIGEEAEDVEIGARFIWTLYDEGSKFKLIRDEDGAVSKDDGFPA